MLKTVNNISYWLLEGVDIYVEKLALISQAREKEKIEARQGKLLGT